MSVLDKALAYAERDMHVFPCKPDKTPLTARGFLDASSDPDEVRRLFADHPDALLAIATGEVSGVVVLDIDTVEGHGVNGFAALKRLGWKIPPTTQVLTPSGGRHFYFKHPGQGERVKSGTIEPGVDLKADGGYVIAPPSIGENGREYKFVGKAKPAPLPQFLTEALSRDKRPATPIAGESIPEGTRNVALTSLAGTMQNRGMTRDAIEAALLAENRTRCEPPLPDDEVVAIAESVARYEPAETQSDRGSAQDMTPAEIAEREQAKRERFRGLPHAEALEREVPPTLELVENMVEAGTVGSVMGLPETGKSWLGLELACKIAANGGRVLGRLEVLQGGPVGYWWQDDSEANMLRRLQSYSNLHEYSDVPITWHLNDGLRLPEDLDVLRAEIEEKQQVFVFLDSLYNFLPGLDLKDEAVAVVLDEIKREVCNPTGCTVAFADHAPWPTDGNQGQRRAYGSVFKAAAIRWHIHIEKTDDNEIWLQAGGNNITGLPRSLGYWDGDRFELRLAEIQKATSDLAERIADFLDNNRGAATSLVQSGVKGNNHSIKAELESNELFQSMPPKLFKKPSNAVCWANAADVPSLLSPTSANGEADVGPTLVGSHEDHPRPETPNTPEGGGGRGRGCSQTSANPKADDDGDPEKLVVIEADSPGAYSPGPGQ